MSLAPDATEETRSPSREPAAADTAVLDAILDASNEAILVIDQAGSIRRFNRRFCEIWNVPEEALEQDSAIEVCESMVRQLEDPEAARDRMFQLLVSSEASEVEVIRVRDGRVIEYRWSPRIVENLVSGGVLTFADVTETRRARSLLTDEVWVNAGLAQIRRQLGWSADTSVMLNRLCEATTEVLECDASHTYLWSPEEGAFMLIAGYGDTHEQWRILGEARPSREDLTELLAGFANDEIVEFETRGPMGGLALAPDAGAPAERTLFMALRRDDEIIGFHRACIRAEEDHFNERQRRLARGTAQLVSLALENARLVQELAYANRRKEQFVSALSHGLRSPLHVILGYTSLLLDEDRDFGREEPRDLVGRIDRSARQLAGMLEDTLSVGLDSSVKDVRVGDVVLGDVLRDIEVETREPRQEAGLAYAWDISPQLPKLHSDGDKIKLILKNLVSNAVKFTEVGGIFVRAIPRDTGVEIAVEDTGVGIGEEAQKIIFEPFRQIDRTHGRTESGTGLGLHVVRRMVDMLGGKISVESEIGQGATFRVWLPAPGAVPSA